MSIWDVMTCIWKTVHSRGGGGVVVDALQNTPHTQKGTGSNNSKNPAPLPRPEICQPCFPWHIFPRSFQIYDMTLEHFQFPFLGLIYQEYGNDVSFPVKKKKKSFQTQVKLPSLLLRVLAFWPTVIKGALFPVTL